MIIILIDSTCASIRFVNLPHRPDTITLFDGISYRFSLLEEGFYADFIEPPVLEEDRVIPDRDFISKPLVRWTSLVIYLRISVQLNNLLGVIDDASS